MAKNTKAAKKTDALAVTGEKSELDKAAEGGLEEPKPTFTQVDVLAALDTDKMFDAVEQMDSMEAEDFKQGDADFWKPEKKGDSISGAFLGTDNSGRIKQHLIAVRGKDDPSKVITVRFNGSLKVTTDIRNNGEPYRALKLVWEGKTKTGNNRELNDFRLFWGPRPSAKISKAG